MDGDLARRALTVWGHDAQIDMMIEECSELILALQHWRRQRVTSIEVASEIADVSIMMEQARLMFGSQEVDRAKSEKLTRLAARLDRKANKEGPSDGR